MCFADRGSRPPRLGRTIWGRRSRRIADVSSMTRLDVELDVLHADVADAPPTSPVHRRCVRR
eukprot:9492671-Pyramimonas_sp.AAC.1